MLFRQKIYAVGLIFLASTRLGAQQVELPHGQDKPPGPALSPQAAIAKMTVPPGFQVELVASEPEIVNPVAMTFDERGRIWVTESFEYPRREPGPGKDRVKVLEDTDGDGKVDKVTVFAEGFNIPSGIAVGHGGVWLANAPDILFLQDTDGDGKADKQEVVVTGFGRDDTHELPNSLTWGPDGWLYGLNGVFNKSVVKQKDKEFRFTCALFRIHPRTREFQLFAEGTSNPWGVAFDGEGSAFVSACVIDHLWHLVETGYYHRQGGPYPPFTWKIESIVSHKHQKAAYCGIHYLDSDAYPAEFSRRLFMGNIHGNCVNVDTLERDGSTYRGKGQPDFLSANDQWFMPVVQKTGPDGSLYVLDWYDRYHCYQDAVRDAPGIDRMKGRLYRVRYKDTPRAWNFDLGKESDEQLIARLRTASNDYFRQTIQRVLTERANPASREALEQLVFDETANRQSRRHALWTLIGSGPLNDAFHYKLITHSEPFWRAWGVRAAGNTRRVSDELKQAIIKAAFDSSADVQLQVAIAANKIEGIDAIAVLTDVLAACGDDRLIPHIVWNNLHPLLETRSEEFVQVFRSRDPNLSQNVTALVPRIVERLLGRASFDARPIANLIARLNENLELTTDAARACLNVLAARVQTRELTGEKLSVLRTAMAPTFAAILEAGATSPLHFETTLLAASWSDAAGIAAAREIVLSADSPAERRLAAFNALITSSDESLISAATEILSNAKHNPAEFRGNLLASLGRFDSPAVAELVLANYSKLEPELQPRAIELLTQRVNWSKALLAAIAEEKVPANALNLSQIRRLLASGDADLVTSVHAKWGKVRDERNPEREIVIGKMKRLIRSKNGDAIAGEKVFKKVCAQCHKIYGEGVDVGPDITLNGRSSFDQLLSNVFDPSLVIGSAYRAQTVVTADGRILTGLLVEDTPQRIALKVQGGKLETIARSDVEESRTSEISMMPEQLENQISPQEMIDLFAYITLDKPPSDPNARRLAGAGEIIPMTTRDPQQFSAILSEVAPGFTTADAGGEGLTLLKEFWGRNTVVQSHAVRERGLIPFVLRGRFQIPPQKKSRLVIEVAHHPQGDFRLIVKANGKPLLDTTVGPKSAPDGWAEHSVELSAFAGESVEIEVHNHPNDWNNEYAYWRRVEVVSE